MKESITLKKTFATTIISILCYGSFGTATLANSQETYNQSKEALTVCGPEVKAKATEIAQKLGPIMDYQQVIDPEIILEWDELDSILANRIPDSNYEAVSVADINQNDARYNEAFGDECVLLSGSLAATDIKCYTAVKDKRKKPWEYAIPLMLIEYTYDPKTKSCAPKKQLFPTDGVSSYLTIPHLSFLGRGNGVGLTSHVSFVNSPKQMFYFEKWKRLRLTTWLKNTRTNPIYDYDTKPHYPNYFNIGKKVRLAKDYFYMQQKEIQSVQGPYLMRGRCTRSVGARCGRGPSYRPFKYAGSFISDTRHPDSLTKFELFFLNLVGRSKRWLKDYPQNISQTSIDRAELRYKVARSSIYDETIINENMDYFYNIGQRNIGEATLVPKEATLPMDPNEPEMKYYHLKKGTILTLTKIDPSKPVEHFGAPFVDPNAKKITREITLTFTDGNGKDYLYRTTAQRFRHRDTEFFLPLTLEVIPN